uniref:aspartate-semialdehyde dehydrogenase n=1 Tax=Ditylum brightwellii TaxID=49249 RepID=A0A6U3XFE1_9STRA|mmetsp:Transcript_9206/g.13454  ORF Transcript_9206/g.13454 Transcript_9206/m.13454 type:complete len:411 (+) Transcript_9206:88-1320(+)
MKFSSVAATALFLLSAPALGFSTSSRSVSSFLPQTREIHRSRPSFTSALPPKHSYANTAMSMSYSVGIVGATGAVGKEIVGVLENRGFPVSDLRIFGSSRSAGKEVETKFGKVNVELFDVDSARECDVVFLAVSGDFALEHAKKISEGEDGAVVIDNSSAFRYEPDVPLCVPEINADATKKTKLVANPNCTTAIGLMALWPLHKLFKVKRVIMSTYQAASGAGQPGMDELKEGTRAVLSGEREVAENKIFAHPLPFNVIPHIDKFQENGYTKEEMKVTWETRKICSLPDDFPLSCTAVRIPTYRAHSESIVIETELPVDVDAARQALEEAPGVKLVDDTANDKYPMPLTATGQEDVEVGRLRKSLVFGDYGLEFFVSGDQLLRGAALNAVLVAEAMIENESIVAKGIVNA